MNTLTDTIAQALSSEGIRDAAIILCAVLLVVALWAYFRLIRRQKRRLTNPAYGPVVRFYQPPPPAEDTRPSRAVHLPAAVTAVSSRTATLDTQIHFSGEPDWPTLSDTQQFNPARTIADDPHPTRPRRMR